jgi:hypothetical protein
MFSGWDSLPNDELIYYTAGWLRIGKVDCIGENWELRKREYIVTPWDVPDVWTTPKLIDRNKRNLMMLTSGRNFQKIVEREPLPRLLDQIQHAFGDLLFVPREEREQDRLSLYLDTEGVEFVEIERQKFEGEPFNELKGKVKLTDLKRLVKTPLYTIISLILKACSENLGDMFRSATIDAYTT